MATDLRNLPAYLNNDADFQTWSQGIHAQLVACGLVQTGDSGQVNLATATRPTAGNTAGYEIFRFSDSQQGTRPFYLKVEYATGGVADRPALWITGGNGSDGAGTITGAGTREKNYSNTSKTVGVTLPSYCSGDGSRISLITNYDSGNNSFASGFIADRSRDANNNTTSEGVTLLHIGNGAGGAQAYCQTMTSGGQNTLIAGSTSIWASVRTGSLVALGGGNTSLGNSVALMPMMVMLGQIRYLLSAVFYSSNDITVGGTAITVANLGGNHTYMPLPMIGSAGAFDSTAMIWE